MDANLSSGTLRRYISSSPWPFSGIPVPLAMVAWQRERYSVRDEFSAPRHESGYGSERRINYTLEVHTCCYANAYSGLSEDQTEVRWTDDERERSKSHIMMSQSATSRIKLQDVELHTWNYLRVRKNVLVANENYKQRD
jgi:hypothetical protein